MKKNLFIAALILLHHFATAQQKYWVLLKDKDTSTYLPKQHLSIACLQNRHIHGIDSIQVTDMPVNQAYINHCQLIGIKIHKISKWLNGFTAILNDDQIEQLTRLKYVREIVKVKSYLTTARYRNLLKRREFSKALAIMEFDEFRKAGLNGENVAIGVIDAGFYNLDIAKYSKHLFSKSRILGIKDFLDPDHEQNFYNNLTGGDSHGREVTKLIAGKTKKEVFGFATEAKFYLARTEHAKKEMRIEEDCWVKAIEWMDSLGVRLINTSLGYATGFDNPLENYKLEDMNGETTLVAKAAKIATEQKGMFIVVSAGNEGNKSNWQIISSPADAKGTLTVGATLYDRSKAGYSSIGPEYIDYLKPNVSAPALNGTSYSAPLITGFVACVMQQYPNLTSFQIKELIEKSGHLYPYGNNYVGYGIPLASRIIEISKNNFKQNINYRSTTDTLVIVDSIEFLPKTKSIKTGKVASNIVDVISENLSKIVVYHKKNKYHVQSMQVIDNNLSKISISRKANTKFSTIDLGYKIIEIEWLEN